MNKKMTYVDAPVAAPAYAGMVNYGQQSLADAVPQELPNGPLTQAELERYEHLEKAYLGGILLPLDIQLAAFEDRGEEPTGINLDHDALGGMTVVEFFREFIPLRKRKSKFGVVSKGPLTQADMDRYVELSKAYLGGPNIPFEIQLAAFDQAGEEPYGILLDHDALGGMTVVEFLREMIPLRDRKSQHGVVEGVHDPEALLEVKQRAVLIYTRCALELAEAEAIVDDARNQLQDVELPLITRSQLEATAKKSTSRMVYFPMPSGAHVGKNGYIHLFPGYPDSPVGRFRGDGAAFSAQECVDFIGKHFPDVEDEFLTALAL